MILITYLIFERLKGQESYWYDYLEVVDPGQSSFNWEEISLSDDPELKMAIT